MTLFSDPAVVEAATKALAWKAACDDDRQTYFHGGVGDGYKAVARPLAVEALAAAVAALDREAIVEKATAHFMDADDHLSPVSVCRGRAVGLLVDLGLIEEEDNARD